MAFFKGVIDVVTLRSERPIRRLLGYYALLAMTLYIIFHFFPSLSGPFGGGRLAELGSEPVLLQDGLIEQVATNDEPSAGPAVDLALETMITILGTILLSLPVSWVYMSARMVPKHDQMLAQTLLTLPIVVAGVVLVVQNSLALAFSLAGVVAAVRFRTTLRDTRDIVFVFLAIGIGFAAGVQALVVGFMVSLVFNLAMLLIWHYDYGRNALQPTAATAWAEPVKALTEKDEIELPARDLALALTPKKAEVLSERIDRVKEILGDNEKKPRFNAVLSLTTNEPGEAQQRIEPVLEKVAKRWKLDQVVPHEGKPSELYYLVRIKKSSSPADLLTAVRTRAGDKIANADVEIGEALAASNGKNGKNGKHP